jgi:hypothetical protein
VCSAPRVGCLPSARRTSDLRDRGCPISALRPPRRPPLRVASPLRAHGNGTAARSPPVAARRPSAAPSAVRPDRTAPNPRNRRSRKPSAASAAWRALPSRCLGRVSAGGWLWLCCASIVCGVPCVAGGGRGSGSARTERSRTASKLISAKDGKAAMPASRTRQRPLMITTLCESPRCVNHHAGERVSLRSLRADAASGPQHHGQPTRPWLT